MTIKALISRTDQQASFLRTLALMRYIISAIILVTFPPHHPNSLIVYGLLSLAAVFCIGQYITAFRSWKVFNSPFLAIIFDNIFLSSFMLLSGGLSTPYGIFIVLVTLSSVYWYGLKGGTGVIAFQSTINAFFLANSYYHPLLLSFIPSTIASVVGLSALIILAERLTKDQRGERTEFLDLESKLVIEQERIMALITLLSEATFIVDRHGKILVYNAGAQNLLLIGKPLTNLMLADLLKLTDSKNQPVDIMSIVATDHAIQRSDFKITASDKTSIPLELRATPVIIKSASSPDPSYIVICRDITKEKSLDQQREEFIAVTSHELRTPLAIAEAALSTALLPQMKASPEVTNMMKQAYRNILFLGELVKDLTTLSQAYNDNIPIQLKLIEPKNMINQLIADYQPEADKKQIELATRIEGQPPAIISTEHFVREILQNFLINAIKYTQQGKITISCKITPEGKVAFSVQDTGIGISVSDQKHLFSKFWRSEDYRTRETGGTGLGLFLCSELANRLNAKVWCQSTINKGSTFYLELPPVSQLKRDRAEVVKAQVSTLVEEL